MNELSFKNRRDFEEDPHGPISNTDKMADDTLLLNIDGFEGPIDILLEMARKQKVDLTQISILQLVRQYLQFIDRAKELQLELAAEYLVMAAWLAYLKSRLLVPSDDDGQEEPDGAEMAAALSYQLQRLQAMQDMAEKIGKRPVLDHDFYRRGQPEGLSVQIQRSYDASLYALLYAYGGIQQRAESATYRPVDYKLMSTEDALQRLESLLGKLPRKGRGSVWAALESFLPEGQGNVLQNRSHLASTLLASLELTKQGEAEIQQDGPFRAIYLRSLKNEN